MVSFTIDRKLLKFPMPNKYKYQLERLFERADAKNNGYITISLSLPKRHGTDAQNRAFHALINEFFLSGCSSFDSVFEMRNYYKLLAGGAKYYIWIDSNGNQRTSNVLDKIPRGSYYVAVPKSWAEFNREERIKAIDLVLKEGFNAGVNSSHWEEIIEGMNND